MTGNPIGRPLTLARRSSRRSRGAGCGPTPPQAPLAQAKKLDAATSDIATECGLTYQVDGVPR